MTKRKEQNDAAEVVVGVDHGYGEDYAAVAVAEVAPNGMVTIQAVNFVETAVATLTASGIITDAENGHRPLFRFGHVEHLAREYVRLGKQQAWQLYRDDLTVVFAFYAEEFDKLVCEAAGE